MTTMRRRSQHRWTLGLGLLLAACGAGSAKYPWASGGEKLPSEHADVHTLNPGYQRLHSQVLVREVTRPTRAALDYAAYHANFMIADPEPERNVDTHAAPNTQNPFAGTLDKATLTGDIRKTPLSEAEQHQPLAFAPLNEYLQSAKVEGADRLSQLGSAVHDEAWGYGATPGSPYQTVSELYLHSTSAGGHELWAKVEFQPWFRPFAASPDQDGDGVPEVYGRVRADLVTAAVLNRIEHDYASTVLSAAEVKKWGHQLSSYWYPSFNTDLAPAGPSWPDASTEAPIKAEIGGAVFNSPTLVLRGKPQGKPTYDVFMIKAAEGDTVASAGAGVVKLPKSKPSPETRPTIDRLTHELEEHGRGWGPWLSELSPLHAAISRKIKGTPPKIKGIVGSDGFLFYRHSLEYVVGGDLEAQRKGKNPLPVIVAFKKLLEAHGVDFLFVPVPTKVEVYPDELDPAGKPLVGKVISPFSRKFLLSLSRAGVEVVDLLPEFLAARDKAKSPEDLLFQHQDTHWTDRGLQIAADALAARVKRYGWYTGLLSHAQKMSERETSFTRFGDLQSRINEADKKKFRPETLVAHQVLSPSGAPYEDDPDSPVVVLGDSFTGVYELTDAEHAGVSAHLAQRISYPTDLVMSYGGGPNVRQKLMRRGADALNDKKLVIWLMTSRDLFDYWEDWNPL